MENKIAKELIECFGYEHQLTELSASDIWDATKSIAGSDEVKSMAKTAGAGAVAGKVASKMLGRAIPGAGTALSWKDAYDRWQAGDRSGAVMSALAGAAYLVPGVGTAVGLGLDAANIGSDLAKDNDKETAEKPETPVNKLTQLQQIIGAKPDGILGPETKQKLMVWQKEQGIKVDGIPGPETYTTAGLAESTGTTMKKTTVAEDIAALRDKLAIIDHKELDEAAWYDAIKAAGKGAEKYASSGFGKIKPPGGVPSIFKKPGLPTGGAGGIGGDISKAAGGAADAGGALAKTGPMSGEYIGKSQKTGGLANKVGDVIDGEFKAGGIGGDISKAAGGVKNVEKAMSALGPEQLQKLSQSVLKNPQLKYSEKYAIQKMGLLNWLKANPGKASLISGIAGTVLGYSLGSDDSKIPTSHPTRHNTGGKRGDPDIMKQQEILNALTDSNLTIDGIWGPQTQAAYEKWKAGADAAEQDMKIRPVPTNAQTPATAPNAAAAAITPNFASQQSVAESIASLRDLLTSIEYK